MVIDPGSEDPTVPGRILGKNGLKDVDGFTAFDVSQYEGMSGRLKGQCDLPNPIIRSTAIACSKGPNLKPSGFFSFLGLDILDKSVWLI